MKKLSFIIAAVAAILLTSCKDKEYDRQAMILSAPDAALITGSIEIAALIAELSIL